MSINYYNKNADKYFESTYQVDMHKLYESFIKHLPKTGLILDLGCGSGRDSYYFKQLGYEIVPMDLASELAKHATNLLEQEVIIQDMRTLNDTNKYTGIWACASILHLAPNEIKPMLERCYQALTANGIFYLSFKYGTTNYSEEERSFTCFDETSFKALIKDLNFEILELYTTGDVRSDFNTKWLNIVLKKN